MKFAKSLIIGLIVVFSVPNLFGQNPDWEVIPFDFEFNGSITAHVIIDDELVSSGTLAAFVGDEVRGVQEALFFPPAQNFYFPIMTFSNETNGEVLSFKFYNGNEVIDLDETQEFVSDMIIGDGFNPLELNGNSTPPEMFQFNQSTLIAFYFFEEIILDSISIAPQDWIGAFNGDVCVGARRISECGDGACDVPIMGDDGEEYSVGYMSAGEYPTFKYFDYSSDEYLEAYPSEEIAWQSLTSPIIEFLTTEPLGTPDCAGIIDGNAVVDDCGVCICGDEINENCTDQEFNADVDCEGVCFGSAIIDDCDVCNGENTDLDCAGECFGSNICGCSDEEACNYSSDVTFDDGSCFYEGCDETQYYQVSIEETGQSQLTIFENTITTLDTFDEIGIFDISGVTETNEDCDNSHNGEILVGAGLWTGTQLEIVSTGSVDMCEFSGPQLAGYIEGHPLVVRVYDASENIEYETSLTFSTGSGIFGELLISISEITLINTELEHFDVSINETGMSSLIIFEDSISILENGDEIALYDANGIIETDSTGQNIEYGEVLVGVGVWSGSQLPIVAIGSVDMSEFNGPVLAGYVDGNPIKARIWDSSENEEFDVILNFSSGSGTYGEVLTAVFDMEVIPQYNIVINEFFFRSASGTSVPDYVELYNGGSEDVDVSGWMINDEDGVIASGTISADGYLLIAGEDPFFDENGDELYAGEDIPNSVFADVSFSTSSDDIALFDADGNEVDAISYDSDTWPTGNSNRGHSAELSDPLLDNSDPANWVSSNAESWLLYDEDGEILNYGTPGEENSVFIPPANDCSGVPNGTAIFDDCGVCICGDEVNENCFDQDFNADMDCLGECFGSALIDDCGVCNGGNADMDCNGECFGNAQILTYCSDNDGDGLGQPGTETEFCDAAVSENWVEDCTDSDDGCESNYYDCAGVCDGSSLEDNCGVCDDDSSNDCVQDCNGEWGGDAQIDDCGVCDGNNADDLGCGCFELAPQLYYEDSDGDGFGYGEGVEYCEVDVPIDWVPNNDDEYPNCTSNIIDCEGICDGTLEFDCADVCGGLSYEDNCGYCDDNPSNDCIQDCSGEWGGINICGCMDEYADNFNNEATFDDGSCEYTQPENFNYNSSTQVAFYYFNEVLDVNNELLQPNDWVAAFRNGVCVGTRRWDTADCGSGVCDLPVMGNDGSQETIGYMLTGEYPEFQIYDASEGEYYSAVPSSMEPWQYLSSPIIVFLSAEIVLVNDAELPNSSYLGQSYPNPFNPITSIDFGIIESGQITISVFDLTGREVEILEQGFYSMGEYSTQWDARKMTSGIYLIKLFTQNQIHTRKVVLIK